MSYLFVNILITYIMHKHTSQQLFLPSLSSIYLSWLSTCYIFNKHILSDTFAARYFHSPFGGSQSSKTMCMSPQSKGQSVQEAGLNSGLYCSIHGSWWLPQFQRTILPMCTQNPILVLTLRWKLYGGRFWTSSTMPGSLHIVNKC